MKMELENLNFVGVSSNLNLIPLGELVSIKGGKRLPKGASLQITPNSHPYIRVRDMGERYIPESGLEYVPDDVFPKIRRYIVHENDVIISIVGTIGLLSIIDSRFHLASQTENAAKLTGLDSDDSHYLYYYLNSNIGKAEISKVTVGAVQPKLPLYNIEKIPVIWPAKSERLEIVKQLKAIDDKIQLNHQINQTLEQIAQAIFKSWFVDFEPVKAKMAAKESWQALQAEGKAKSLPDLETWMNLAAMQVISGQTEEALNQMADQQPEQFSELFKTAALFPAAMQDSELGEIPEGWTPTTLDQLIELAYGKALKKDARIEGQYRVYGSGGVTGSHNEFLVSGPGIIVGRKGTVGSLYWEPDNFYPIDTTFYVTVKKGYSLEFAYYLLQTLGLSDMNTDAAVPGLNRNNVYRLEIPRFPEAIVGQFSQILKPISERMSISNSESRSLTELRDTLLPKLLSGELSVSNIGELDV